MLFATNRTKVYFFSFCFRHRVPTQAGGAAVEYGHSEDGFTPTALISGSYDKPCMIFMSAPCTYRLSSA